MGKTKYLDGKISDGKKVDRVLAYNPRLKSQMDRFRNSHTVAALVDCAVKKELQPASVVSEPRYEIVLCSRTKVEAPPKQFVMPENIKEIDPYAARPLRDLSEVEHVVDRQLVERSGCRCCSPVKSYVCKFLKTTQKTRCYFGRQRGCSADRAMGGERRFGVDEPDI